MARTPRAAGTAGSAATTSADKGATGEVVSAEQLAMLDGYPLSTGVVRSPGRETGDWPSTTQVAARVAGLLTFAPRSPIFIA